MAVGAFISGASARHLAARFAAPGTVLIGLGLEVVGVVVLALLMGPSTSAWLVALPLVGYGVGLCLASAQPTGTVLRDVTVASSGQASATAPLYSGQCPCPRKLWPNGHCPGGDGSETVIAREISCGTIGTGERQWHLQRDGGAVSAKGAPAGPPASPGPGGRRF
ncbi:hypothetical protein [Kocuria sp. UBA5001]|uniref:hypothetical protein n=1 Tax=Kocuria sp. UBA5001 TaxID=1946674 RepID=UPI0032E4C8D0